MTVTGYLVNSLAWSGLGLLAGAALAQVGCDIRALIRASISGRKRRDHT